MGLEEVVQSEVELSDESLSELDGQSLNPFTTLKG